MLQSSVHLTYFERKQLYWRYRTRNSTRASLKPTRLWIIETLFSTGQIGLRRISPLSSIILMEKRNEETIHRHISTFMRSLGILIDQSPLRPLRWLDLLNVLDRVNGIVNSLIEDNALKIAGKSVKASEIGIISPYSQQVRKLRNKIGKHVSHFSSRVLFFILLRILMTSWKKQIHSIITTDSALLLRNSLWTACRDQNWINRGISRPRTTSYNYFDCAI